jgi:hypothetical protein
MLVQRCPVVMVLGSLFALPVFAALAFLFAGAFGRVARSHRRPRRKRNGAHAAERRMRVSLLVLCGVGIGRSWQKGFANPFANPEIT